MDRDGCKRGLARPSAEEAQRPTDNGSGEDNGGAAEEMDQDGSGVGGLSGRVHPKGWETKTRKQKGKYWKRRRPRIGNRCQEHSGGIGICIAGDERRPGRSVWAFRAMRDRALLPFMGAAAGRLRQAFARPQAGPLKLSMF